MRLRRIDCSEECRSPLSFPYTADIFLSSHCLRFVHRAYTQYQAISLSIGLEDRFFAEEADKESHDEDGGCKGTAPERAGGYCDMIGLSGSNTISVSKQWTI